jgi:hypothetical protein
MMGLRTRSTRSKTASSRRVEPPLVLDRVGPIREFRKLSDIRARDERLATRPLQNQDAHLVMRVHMVARPGQRLVHGPGHRVASIRAVERQRGDGAIDFEPRVARPGALRALAHIRAGLVNHER